MRYCHNLELVVGKCSSRVPCQTWFSPQLPRAKLRAVRRSPIALIGGEVRETGQEREEQL